MKKRLIIGFIGVLGLSVLLGPIGVVMAAAVPTQSSGEGLEISPPVIELTANPGQTITTTIRVRNVATSTLIAKGRADDFGAGSNEDGQPQLLLNEQGETRYSLKYWISNVPDLLLAPQELKTASITITVPANAEPGGHFGVIRFTAVPPNLDGTGVSLSASIGSLILLRVNGAITDNVQLAEFSTGKINKDGTVGAKTNFFEYGPVGFLVRLHNGGSVHEKAQGSIAVTDVFGKNVATIAVNPIGGNVLPDSIRRFEQTLSKKTLFGYYTAKMNLTYLGGQKKLSGQVGFWVIPWMLILIAIIILAVLFFALKFALKKYNQHIIAQARRR
jgi:hypothetical protein